MEIADEGYPVGRMRHEHDWKSCAGSGKFVRWQYTRIRVRCPDCNKRLLLCETENADEYGAMFYLPRHKAKIKTRKTTRKGK